MGTRSTTSFYKRDHKHGTPQHLLTYYRQYDGYPTYYGSQLAEFIDNCEIVNGFTTAMKGGTHANGVGCLVAQILMYWKNNDGQYNTGLGGLYIQPESTKNGEAYHYDVVFDENNECSILVFRYGEPVGSFTPEELINNAVHIEAGE